MRRSRIGRLLLVAAALATLVTAGFVTARALADPAATAPAAESKTCSAGYVHAVIGGQEKCLKAGEFCSAQYEADYEQYGFSCVSGRLETSTSTGTTSSTTTTTTTSTSFKPKLGRTILLRHLDGRFS